MKNEMNILGIMSGTSLDGIDFSICSFEQRSSKWTFHIHASETIPYPAEWLQKLRSAPHLSGIDLLNLHQEYGRYIADRAASFIRSSGLEVGLISSHGHTVFHQPEAGFTMQAGDPQVIATSTGITTVGDFRKLDVLLGGQGAPLVPVGDHYLFGEYDYCLNLGGFANISYQQDDTRLARDICPVNIVLNQFSAELELPYDREGSAGRSGNLSGTLLDRLNRMDYYHLAGPGSLGREWVEDEFMPVIRDFQLPVTDILRTVYEHIAFQIGRQIRRGAKVLVTGGGVYNLFLLERIREVSRGNIIIPSADLVEFKEALVFSFLGLLRLGGQINCFASVTGASRDSCCGVVYRN
jgi:anhydro-N-acetylmuramic acid kinase